MARYRARTDEQEVTVIAGSLCDAPFTLTLTAGNEMCSNTGNLAVMVNDTTPPDLTVPPGLVLECANSDQASRIAAWQASASATDACGPVTLGNNYAPAAFSHGPNPTGAQEVTFTATDHCGNVTSLTAWIRIVDTTPPDIICPQDLTIECADPQQSSTISDCDL